MQHTNWMQNRSSKKKQTSLAIFYTPVSEVAWWQVFIVIVSYMINHYHISDCLSKEDPAIFWTATPLLGWPSFRSFAANLSFLKLLLSMGCTTDTSNMQAPNDSPLVNCYDLHSSVLFPINCSTTTTQISFHSQVEHLVHIQRLGMVKQSILFYMLHLPKTNITMEQQPFEDESPINKNCVPLSC